MAQIKKLADSKQERKMRIWTDHGNNDLRIASVLTPEYESWSDGVKAAISKAIAGQSTGNIAFGQTLRVAFVPPLKPLLMSDPVAPVGCSTAFGVAIFQNMEGLLILVDVEMPFGYDGTN